jgi:hypothetical protein
LLEVVHAEGGVFRISSASQFDHGRARIETGDLVSAASQELLCIEPGPTPEIEHGLASDIPAEVEHRGPVVPPALWGLLAAWRS